MRSPPRPKLMTFDEPFPGSYFMRIFVQEFHNNLDILHMMYHRSNSSGGLFTEERKSFVKEKRIKLAASVDRQ